MNLNQYLSNPYGKGSAAIPVNSIKADLNAQYDMLKDKIKMDLFTNDKSLIYRIDIPSRKTDKVYYNVIIEYDISKLQSDIVNINTLDFKCFSNCPSFTFTYAYIFDKRGLLCEWLKDKYEKEIFSKPPDTRNEYQLIGFERTLYIAFKHILSSGRNKLGRAKILAKKFKNYRDISGDISSQEEIRIKYDNELTRIKGEKKKDKDNNIKRTSSASRNGSKGFVKTTTTSKKIGTAGKTKKTSKSKKF